MSGLPNTYNPGESLLQGGTSVPIHPVQGGGAMQTDPSVSLLSGGETASIVPVQGGGDGQGGNNSNSNAFSEANEENSSGANEENSSGANEENSSGANEENSQNAKKPEWNELDRIKRWSGNQALSEKEVVGRATITPIMLAGKIYMIRNPVSNAKISDNWKAKIFTGNEIELLEDLGVKEPSMIKEIFGEGWGEEVGDFFENLLSSSCFKDTMFLSNRQCERSRKFIKKLVEGIIANDPEFALLKSDETLGPLVELEEEKQILEEDLSSAKGLILDAKKEIKNRIQQLRTQRVEYEKSVNKIKDQVKMVKHLTGLNVKMTLEEIEMAMKKNPIEDGVLQGVTQVSPAGQKSALQGVPVSAGTSVPIYQDTKNPGIYIRKVSVSNILTKEQYLGEILTDNQVANQAEAEKQLTDKLANLEKTYIAWRFQPA